MDSQLIAILLTNTVQNNMYVHLRSHTFRFNANRINDRHFILPTRHSCDNRDQR